MEIFKTINPLTPVTLYFLLIFFFIPFASTFAQNSSEQKDSITAERYYAKSVDFQTEGLSDSATFYANQAADLFAQQQLWGKWYDARYDVYLSLVLQRKFEEVLKELHKDSVTIIPKTESLLLSAKINDWLGYVYYAQELFEEALQYYLAGVKLLEQAGNPEGRYGNLTNIGIIYTMQGDYDLAITYLKQSEAVNLADKNTHNNPDYNRRLKIEHGPFFNQRCSD